MTEAERPDGLSGRRRTRDPGDFDVAYATGTPPWDIGRPQPAFRALADDGRLVGRVLDVGCGTGEHALLAAALGLVATGVDTSATAIAIARRKAEERALHARFLVQDALDLGALGESFDTVLDCGLFHVFDDADRATLVEGLRASMPVGARYHLLCFSDAEPGDWGPRRIRQEEIRRAFADGWRVETIEPTSLEVTIDPGHAHAWLAAIVRA
ncbi:class I SAM-dependent methyltransferase [Oryzihumus leptocrescens]|uniref:Methyltransferase family protein n=1 Tax=Oryzihumus leptocrescens TaxID=297536 RepID=A0A542ZHL5_9MICO|nr:class I SAM-dependent methyltransferase [Oryzihumus leptocrescens]TQL59824.1 methyltransferase family protein [Oryzihumus leptocrescens]